MLEIRNISKKYKDFNLDNINFLVESGEYFVLLGESGAGKSLILEIIAGLITPDNGKILLNSNDITNQKIQKRNIGLVFQDYAIFPHLSVFENISYPLHSKKLNKSKIHSKVVEFANKTGIGKLLKRNPSTLSGGELQRVSLARTLAMEPNCLLLDEPLSSLDIQLRNELQQLLRKLHYEGITIVHVTHNFDEAMALANKVGIIKNGRIIQTGTPKEVFHNPTSKFVANFTGIKNFYNAEIKSKEIVILDDKVEIIYISGKDKGNGIVMFRSEDIVLSINKPDSSMCNNLYGSVLEMIPTKFGMEIIIDIGVKISALITQKSVDRLQLSVNKHIWISIKASAIKFM